MEQKPELKFRSYCEAELRVERTGISFEDVEGDRVRITVTVTNEGTDRSPATRMRLESAPLGAFLPWRPLTQLLVPPLQPGESRELSTAVVRPRPVPLGDFDRVPPKKLLTAINSPDQPMPQSDPDISALLGLWREKRPRPAGDTVGTSLATDFWDLLGRGQQHWAGNINVFVGRRSVERHLAQALRVYPGCTNLTIFMVGSPEKPDAYAFELVGLDPDWKAALLDVSDCESLILSSRKDPVQEKNWVETDSMMMLLELCPPPGCGAGKVAVHVTRRSCGKTAIVEFNLDPCAKGPGCYSV